MIHRFAIILGGIAAAMVLGLGLAATGLTPAAAPVDAEQPQAAAVTATDAPSVKPITRVETTTVYVRPAPKPKVIHVTKRAPASTVTKQPKVKIVHVTKVVPSKRGGDDGGEHEGGDD